MKNTKIQKLISSFLIILILIPAVLFSAPKKANAFLGIGDITIDSVSNILAGIGLWIYRNASLILDEANTTSTITNTGISAKNLATSVYQEVLRAIARRALQEMTKSTVNWINSGFHGSPLFLENSGSFFQDIAKSEVKTLVDQFGYDLNRFPFGKDWALNTIGAYKSTLANNAAYSLNQAMSPSDAYNFRTNFNVGGWNGFLTNTQYPQNNYLGFNMIATNELALRISGTVQTAAQQVQTTLQQGNGFLSPQKCMDPDTKYNDIMANQFQRPVFDEVAYRTKNPFNCTGYDDDPAYKSCADKWESDYEKAKADWAKDNTCKNLVNTTPGSVAGAQITKALGITQDQATFAGAMGNSLSAIFDALLNKFIGDGLTALTSNRNPQPTTDTWTYGGQSLDSGSSNSNDPFGGYDEVVILKDFKKLLNGYYIGSCTLLVGNPGDAPVVQKDIPQEDCSTAGGTWVQNPAGTDYIPGDIANTETEKKLMDNPSDSNNPGILQTILPIIQKVNQLDVCLPGPEKGWEARLNNEREINVAKFGLKGGFDGNDPLKTRAMNEGIKELKFAVDSFKNWLTTKMALSLPGASIYMDAISSINDYPQTAKETIDSSRVKLQTIARLKMISKTLESFTEQPKPNTALEKTLISLKKQYNAVKTSVSSTNSMEDIKNKLNILKDKLAEIESLNTQCSTEKTAAGWTRKKEIDQLCTTAMVSGYSHGTVIRNDEAARESNCPDLPGGGNSISCNNKGGSENVPDNWFSFRNPHAKGIPATIPPSGYDLGDPGYEDLPMVNAREVFGDNGNDVDRVSIQIDCKVVFKANPLDYINAGNPTP